MKKILITGANSYIGTSLESWLGKRPEEYSLSTIDMKDKGWEEKSFNVFDCVFHVAGIAHVSTNPNIEDTYYKINRDVAIKTAMKAKSEGVKQFILMSSIIVYGDNAGKAIDLSTIPNPKNFYGKSKLEAEEGIRKLDSNEFKVVVLRPPMVYGKGCKGNYPKLSKLAKVTPVLPNFDNVRSMIHIDNLCEFIRAIIDNEESGTFYPQNRELVSTSNLVEAIGTAYGRDIKRIRVLNPFIRAGIYLKIPLLKKIFGNLYYDQNISKHLKTDYQIKSFTDSIIETEFPNHGKKAVIVNCFDTYEDRVDLVLEFLKMQGYEVSVIQSDFRHFQKVHRSDSKPGFTFIKSKPYYKNLSVSRLCSHYNYAGKAFKTVKELNAGVLYVLVPPNSLAWFATKYKGKNKNVKLIFDLIDLWPETMPLGKLKKFPPFSFWGLMRDVSYKKANYVITECNLYREVLGSRLDGINTSTVYLAKKDIDVISNPNPPDDVINLAYLGSINNIIDIQMIKKIIESINKIKPVNLHIIGDGESKYELITFAQAGGATVVDHGKVYDSQKKQDIFDQCHFGLNIMKSTVCVGLTMKSIDYFQHGLPILNNIPADTAGFVTQYGVGVNIFDLSNLDIIMTYLESYGMNNRIVAKDLFNKHFSERAFNDSLSNIIIE